MADDVGDVDNDVVDFTKIELVDNGSTLLATMNHCRGPCRRYVTDG